MVKGRYPITTTDKVAIAIFTNDMALDAVALSDMALKGANQINHKPGPKRRQTAETIRKHITNQKNRNYPFQCTVAKRKGLLDIGIYRTFF